MSDQTGAYNLYAAELMIEELVRCGVEQFCLSPGARCTPLTIAVADHPTAERRIFHDERAAAYHALGYARATGRAAVLICTSGTAAANYLPAVVEASMDMVPMILLTADRPPELRDCGANQAIDQQNLYGHYTRWYFDVPCPDKHVPPESILTMIDQAVHRAHSSPAGPVHLNCMFREPLLPNPHTDIALSDSPALATWRGRQRPFTIYEPRQTVLSDDQLKHASDIIDSAASGLLVVGRLSNDTERTAVERFARHLGWPVLPDILSGLRLGAECDAVIPYYDLLLQSVDAWKIAHPAVALHLGGRVVSKRLMTFLKAACFDEQLHVADHPYRHDWQHMVTRRLECSPVAFCEAVTPLVTTAGEFELKRQLRQASAQVGAIVQRTTEGGRDLSEPGIARLISQNIPEDAGLFVANSLSIRLMDSCADLTRKSVTQTPPVACNRGASGIDGTIATAAGYAVGLARPVTLLLGDLALLHDLNSLAIVRSLEYPMTIVLINNDGGGIFSLLPVAEREDIFEKYFATPHGLTFASSAKQFGLEYHTPTTPDEFVECYRRAVGSKRSALIEARTNREGTRDLYRKLLDEAAQTIPES